MWMNEHEIERALELVEERLPDVAPYARFLLDWKDVVNANSDGWPYWKPASRAAHRLMEGVSDAVDSLRDSRKSPPSADDLRRALTPIRSFATKHGLPAPTLGEPPSSPVFR